MKFISFEDSKFLKENDALQLNQRLNDLKYEDGTETDFVVKTDDIVIFKRTLNIDEENKKHKFIVMLLEDVIRENTNREVRYGEFILNNYQVIKSTYPILNRNKS